MYTRRRGFSLVELSFVIVIMLILGGLVAAGGTYMTKEAQVKTNVEKAKEFLVALKRYEAEHAVSGFPYPKSATWAALSTDLWRYMPSYSTVQQNPFDTSVGGFSTYPNPCLPGAICAGFSSASFPQTPGRLEYLFKDSPTANAAAFSVWNGAQYRSFEYYAITVNDGRGYPVFTDGH